MAKWLYSNSQLCTTEVQVSKPASGTFKYKNRLIYKENATEH